METEPDSPSTSSSSKQARSFARAFVATSYLLGRRRGGLSEGVSFADPVAQQVLLDLTQQLSHGVQEQRARALAAEVARLMRSLDAQRIR